MCCDFCFYYKSVGRLASPVGKILRAPFQIFFRMGVWGGDAWSATWPGPKAPAEKFLSPPLQIFFARGSGWRHWVSHLAGAEGPGRKNSQSTLQIFFARRSGVVSVGHPPRPWQKKKSRLSDFHVGVYSLLTQVGMVQSYTI